MMMQFAKVAVSFSLLLSAPVAAPAYSAGKQHDKANCPYAKAKTEKAKRVAIAAPARGIMVVEHRKRDVQILSFGP
jgi:hypothetical protein